MSALQAVGIRVEATIGMIRRLFNYWMRNEWVAELVRLATLPGGGMRLAVAGRMPGRRRSTGRGMQFGQGMPLDSAASIRPPPCHVKGRFKTSGKFALPEGVLLNPRLLCKGQGRVQNLLNFPNPLRPSQHLRRSPPGVC